MGDFIHIAKGDQLVGQQPQRPVLTPCGRSRASQRQQVSFGFTVQFALSPTSRATAMQRCIQPLFDKALANTMDGLATDIEGIFDSLISPSRTLETTISLEQDLGMDTGTTWCGASVDQFTKFSALISSQGYNAFSGHRIEYLQAIDDEPIGCWILPDPCPLTKYRLTHY